MSLKKNRKNNNVFNHIAKGIRTTNKDLIVKKEMITKNNKTKSLLLTYSYAALKITYLFLNQCKNEILKLKTLIS